MKTKYSKILSVILVLASLLSCFAIFAHGDDGAPSTPQAPNASEVDLVLYRNFEEGWDYSNGFTAVEYQKSYVDFEEDATFRYNYFWRFEATTSTSAGYSKLDFRPNVQREDGTVVQFKIKADDACNVGKILYLTTPGGVTFNLLYISGTTLYAYEKGSAQYKVADLTNEWLTLTFVFDWDSKDADGNTLFNASLYVGENPKPLVYQANYVTSKGLLATDVGMQNLYIGIEKGGASLAGMGFCVDDLQIYNGAKVAVSNIESLGTHGSKINDLAEIVIDVQEAAGGKNTEQIIAESLCMKVGVDKALIRNVKTSIANYCTPVIIDGEVMIPLELILDFIGYPYYVHTDGSSYDITTGTSATYITIGRDSATVDGKRIELTKAPGYLAVSEEKNVPVIAAADITTIFPGWCLTYDDMGLIIIYEGEASEEGESLITRENDLDLMLTIMKRFVFDIVTTDENGVAFEEVADSYVATGSAILADVVANTESAHPYIFVNQAQFDAIKGSYLATENADPKLQSYIATLKNKADAIYNAYANVSDGEYDGIADGKKPVNVYNDGKNPDPTVPTDTTVTDTSDGYNTTGTLESIETYTEELVSLAFAYQVTGDEKYALLAYDFALALGEWNHWGPGYMINCATAAGNFAVAYDWLYNFNKENFGQEGVDALANILYTKGLSQGYAASMGMSCDYPRTIGDEFEYATLTNNWNAACSSGMIMAAIALADYDEYAAESAYLVGNNIQNLIANGLDQYAPDGSYAESALLWADATNAFMKIIMGLQSAAGSAYGFENTWGIDKTFYFACYIEDSDGKIWNYHEGGADGLITGEILGIDTQMFNYAGMLFSDSVLVAIRENQINRGKEVSIFDVLFYPENVESLDVELALDYHMEGIQAFVSRSGWEDGALYTGIMGGSNDVYGGQIDSGNFIYRNDGIDWFMDLGSDNNEAYGYFGSYRYRYYRNNAEGQNVVFVTSAQGSLPYGQDKAGGGTIVRTAVNEHGSYAIIDNTSAYSSIISYANRGMLVTNDRKTVVIQDEMSFKKVQEMTWVAHTAAEITIYNKEGKVDTMGKTAYLTVVKDGAVKTLRATLVSEIDFYFEVESAETSLLSNTLTSKEMATLGGAEEYSRKGLSRLVINSGQTFLFTVAVVIEEVDSIGSTEPVGYEWIDMRNWVPVAEGTQLGSAVPVRGTAVKSDIRNETTRLGMFKDTLGTAFTKNIADYYQSLTLIEYTLKTFDPENFDSIYNDAYSTYLDHFYAYDDYLNDINGGIEANTNFAMKLAGIGAK